MKEYLGWLLRRALAASKISQGMVLAVVVALVVALTTVGGGNGNNGPIRQVATDNGHPSKTPTTQGPQQPQTSSVPSNGRSGNSAGNVVGNSGQPAGSTAAGSNRTVRSGGSGSASRIGGGSRAVASAPFFTSQGSGHYASSGSGGNRSGGSNGSSNGGSNGGAWVNDRYEELMAKAEHFKDEAELDTLMKEIQNILTEQDPPAIFMGAKRYYTVLGADIRGFVANPIYLEGYNLYDLHREG